MPDMWEKSHTPRICNERDRTGLLATRILLPAYANKRSQTKNNYSYHWTIQKQEKIV